MVDVNQWNTANDKWLLSLLQPPTIYREHAVSGLGRQGLDRLGRSAGKRCSRSTPGPESLKWTFDALPKSVTCEDRHGERLGYRCR